MHTLTTRGFPKALLQYASHHRDERNILLHIISVPMTIFAFALLVSAIAPVWATWASPLGWSALLLILYFYIRSVGFLGLITSTLIIMLCLVSQLFNQRLAFISSGILFVIGYLAHRLGHWYEGAYTQMRLHPSFIFYAPLFVTAHLFKRTPSLQRFCEELELQAGPTYVRDMINDQRHLY